MSFTGLQNTFVPLSINGLSSSFSSDTNAGDLTATSIVINGTKNPLLSFPVSQDNITQFNSKYILQYSNDFGTTTTDILNATNAKLTIQVPLALYSGLDLSGNITTTGSIQGSYINSTGNILGVNITASNNLIVSNSITATSPNVYLVANVQYISAGQLLVTISPTLDPYSAGDVLNIIDNPVYNGQVAYQYNASPSAFYVSNPGYGNNGTQYGGSISKNSGVINSNITRNKQNVIDSLYTFKKDPSNSNLQLLYSSDSNLYYFTPAGRFRSIELECKTSYIVNSNVTGAVSYVYGGNTWSQYQTSGNNFNLDYNSVNKTFIDSAGKLTSRSLAFINDLSTATVTLTSAEVSTLSGIDTSTTIQAQINALSGSGFITKTGTTAGVNATLQLNTNTSTFLINGYLGVLYPLLCVNFTTAGDTFIKNVHSTSLINSKSASYYDISSSLTGLLDNKISTNGTTIIQLPVLKLLASTDYIQWQDETGVEMAVFGKSFQQFRGEVFFISNGTAGIRISYGASGKGAMFRNDTNDFYILVSDTYNGSFNALRPFFINLTSGLLQSNNSQTFQGLTNLQSIQFSGLPTYPNGLTYQNLGNGILNYSINFNATADRAVDNSAGGILFELNNRVGFDPFRFQYRAPGDTTSYKILNIRGSGYIDSQSGITVRSNSSSQSTILAYTAFNVGDNNAFLFGANLASANMGVVNFNWTASGSLSNFLGFGMYGYLNRFKLYPNKAIFEDPVTVPSIKVGSGTISTQINPYILSRTEAYNPMEYGETMSCVIFDRVAWTTGSTYISWFRKFTDNSTLSFVGNVTAYSTGAGQNIYWRITFDNLTDGSSYVHEYNFYFNQAFVHTTLPCVGVVSNSGNSGFGTFATAGIYTVTFVRLNAYMASDAGDSINIHFLITPNFRGK